MTLYECQGVSYHVNTRLYNHWQKNSLKYMNDKNSDRVYIVDGQERIGKSVWTMQQAAVLDPDMFSSPEKFLPRICFSPEDFLKAIRTVKNSVIIFDEAFRGFSSRAALSRVNKKLVQALMEMGQNNNIVFIVLPSFFLLDIYPAMLRSNGLFNIKLDKKSGKRMWRGFNKKDKNMIYQQGLKKGWTYNRSTAFKGNFYDKFPGGETIKQAYLNKKLKSLQDIDDENITEESRFAIGYKIGIANLYLTMKKHEKISQEKFVELLKNSTGESVNITRSRLAQMVSEVVKDGKLLIVNS